jgi:hypothetical protein
MTIHIVHDKTMLVRVLAFLSRLPTVHADDRHSFLQKIIFQNNLSFLGSEHFEGLGYACAE